MTPRMVEALYHISLLYTPEPETVFQKIAETVAEMYGDTMAMVNLVEGDCLRFRTVVNPHPAFENIRLLNQQQTLCQFALRFMRPLLIQNAMEHPDFCRHGVVALKLRRYLGVPIYSSEGNTVGTLCFLDDQIEEILGEEDIQFLSLLAMRVSAELERERMIEARIAEQCAYAERLAVLNQRLRDTAEEKRKFVSMVIHDLRHPLTTLRTSLYLLRIETDQKQRHAHLDMLEKRTRALATLLDELVLYDQIETGRSLLKIEEVDLEVLVCACVEEAAGVASEQAMPVHCEIAPDLGTAHIDGGKLKHILLNLVANALKFTPEGRIIVRAYPVDAERWRLEVEDTGIGMTSCEQQRAFEEYFACAEERGGGMGLGLAIVHRLCTVLNAQITLQSLPGQGTCFHLVFPRKPPVPIHGTN